MLLGLVYAGSLLADEQIHERIKRSLSRYVDTEIIQIKPLNINKFYEVVLGADVVYVDSTGRFVLQGDLIDLSNQQNLSELVRDKRRATLFSQLKSDSYIEFAATKPKHNVYIFTDISCSYCRLLHRDIAMLNGLGINVRYLAFPRQGLNSQVARDMQMIWCADDRQASLTLAKQNVPLGSSNRCDDPVTKHYELGRKVGVRGTPAIYSEDGRSLAGYAPPDELIKLIEK